MVLRYRPGLKLQWGRDFNVAESTSANRFVQAVAALQWGRDFNVAESPGAGCGLADKSIASMGPRL